MYHCVTFFMHKIKVLWDAMLHCWVNIAWHWRTVMPSECLNVSPSDHAWHLRKLESSATLLWEPHIWQWGCDLQNQWNAHIAGWCPSCNCSGEIRNQVRLLFALLYNVPKLIRVPDGAVVWVGLIVVTMSLPCMSSVPGQSVCICDGKVVLGQVVLPVLQVFSSVSFHQFSVPIIHSFVHVPRTLCNLSNPQHCSVTHLTNTHTQWSCCSLACYNVIPSHVIIISWN